MDRIFFRSRLRRESQFACNRMANLPWDCGKEPKMRSASSSIIPNGEDCLNELIKFLAFIMKNNLMIISSHNRE